MEVVREGSRGGFKGHEGLKFDRRLSTPFENDVDVVSLIRGNDGYAYLYISGVEGPCVHAAVMREQQVHDDYYCEAIVAAGVHWEGQVVEDSC